MTLLAYCWDENDYFTHSEPCTIDPIESTNQSHAVYVLPANGCFDAPIFEDGKWPKRVNGVWINVENHVDEEGYVNGVPTKITEYGPLPGGWSTAPTPPTTYQLFSALRSARNKRLSDTDKYTLADYPISAENLEAVKLYRSALRGLPDAPGAPWDGGGESTPWPGVPDIIQAEQPCA